MAARRTTTQSRPGKVRHGGRSAEHHAVLRWLQVGAVAAGVGAAVAAGQGVATASTGTDGSGPAADSGDNTSTHRHFGIHRSVAGTPAKSETDSAASASEAGTDPASPASTSVLHSPLHIGVRSHPFAGLLHRPGSGPSQGTPTPDVAPSNVSQGTRTLQAPVGLTTVSAHFGLAGAAHTREAAGAPEAAPFVLRRFAPATPTDTSLDTVPNTKTPVASLFSTRPAHPAQGTATPVTLQSIAADLSAWSLGTPDTDLPAAPVGNVLQALWLGVRRVHYTLFNSYPHAAPTQGPEDQTTGVVTGALNGYDADGDHLTYDVVTPPERGAVELVGGTYIYTPDADLASTGGTDTFTVSIDDRTGNPWHIHGLSEVLQDCRPRLTTQKVTVTVAQVIADPSIVATPGAADPGTGAVVITTAVTPQTIPVTVTAAHSGNGTLVDNGDGTWTYTPSDADRTTASQVGAPVTFETITFTATNTTDPTKVGTDAVDVAIEPLVNTVIGSYAVDHPWSVAVSADGKTAYVTSIYNGVVSIVNTKTGEITPIPLAAGSEPVSAVLNPSNGSIYVPNFVAGGGVLVINPDNTFGATIAAGYPRNVAFSPDGNTAYVANQQNLNPATPGSITVVNANGDVTGILPVPANFHPQDLAVSSDGSQLYVLNNAGAGSVAILDASNGNVATTIAVPGAFDMAISPDRSTLYVATVGTNVAVIDTSTNTVSQNPITVNGQPRSVAVSPHGKTVYVTVATTGANDSLAVVNRTTNVVTYIAVPKDANTVAISPDGTHAYVTSTSSNAVTVISLGPATPAPVATVSV